MKFILSVLVWFFIPLVSLAAVVNFSDSPFATTTVAFSSEDEFPSYLGTLSGAPHLYEFTLTAEETPLSITLAQPAAVENPLTFIMVQKDQATGAIGEVGRLLPTATWTEQVDAASNLSLRVSAPLARTLPPGTYRLEVSSPDNTGTYWLRFTADDTMLGYPAALKQVYQLQHFFGYSSLHLLSSYLVYYPLGMVVVLLGMYATWRYRAKFAR